MVWTSNRTIGSTLVANEAIAQSPTKDRSTACNRSSMLFTLSNGADASETIDRINVIKTGAGSNPLPQSSGDGIVAIENIIN